MLKLAVVTGVMLWGGLAEAMTWDSTTGRRKGEPPKWLLHREVGLKIATGETT